MNPDHTSHSVKSATIFAEFTALLSIAVGVIVIFGWAYDIDSLKSILPGWFPLKANAAICLILIGLAMKSTLHTQVATNTRCMVCFTVARICMILCGLIASLTLCEYIFGWNLGIDQWLFSEPKGAIGTSHPGRMAQEAALDFLLLSIALWLTGNLRKPHLNTMISVTLGIMVSTVGMAALLSYLTPGLGPYGWFGFSIMAIHAAAMLTLLGIAVIVINWRPNTLSWAFNRSNTIAIVFGMLILVLIGFNTSRSQFSIKETSHQIEVLDERLNNIKSFLIEMIKTQSNLRAYLATEDGNFKNRYLESQAKSTIELSQLKKKFGSTDQHFNSLLSSANQMLQWFPKVVEAKEKQKSVSELKKMVINGTFLMNTLLTELSIFENEQFQQKIQLKLKIEQTSQLAYSIIFIGTLLSLLIFIMVIFRLSNVIIQHRKAEAELLENEKELRISATAFESHEGILITDASANIIRVNQTFTKLTGYSANEVLGKNPRLLKSDYHHVDFYVAMWQSILNTGSYEGEVWNRRKDGNIFPEQLTITAVKDRNGNITNFVGIFTDISVRKANEARMGYLANHDQLTELPNRDLFYDRLSQAISQARRKNEQIALLFLDLDGFKPVNDQYGHDAGDSALKTVAIRLQACVRTMDTVARIGGDEFSIILSALQEPLDAEIVAQKIIHSISETMQLNANNSCVIGVSIGIAIYPENGTELDRLMNAADTAMYESKSKGKNTYTISSIKEQHNSSCTLWISPDDIPTLGIPIIDEQHQTLISMLNAINNALKEQHSAKDMNKLLEELVAFTDYHFKTEERLMKEYNYTEYQEHQASHNQLLSEVTYLKEKFSQGGELFLLQKLKDWLAIHTLDSDKSLADFIKNQRGQ